MKTRKLKRVVIKEEFIALTECHIQALVLNQLLYWQDRVKDFDQFIREEKTRNPQNNMPLSHGWVYKKSSELSEELMIGKSDTTVRKAIKSLIELGLISERSNPENRWDKTKQYRVNLVVLNHRLEDIGYRLEGYYFQKPENLDSIPRNLDSNPENLDSNPNFEGTYIRNTEITSEITNIDPPFNPPKTEPENEGKEVFQVSDKFSAQFKGLRTPWRTGTGINDFDTDFIEWLQKQWKQDSPSNAKAFLRNADNNLGKNESVLGYWDDYKNLTKSESSADASRRVDRELQKLGIINILPFDLQERFGVYQLHQLTAQQKADLLEQLTNARRTA